MAGEMIYYYSALWAALEDGAIVTVGGEDHVIGTDAFNDYGKASTAAAQAEGTIVQDLDTYYDTTWTDGGTATIYARGGTYTTIASATKSGTTNAFTTEAVAREAHTSYYPDGGCVISGSVTSRAFLNGHSKYQLILNNYSSTGGGDQGLGLGALDTKTTNGVYVVVGQGSNLNVVYIGHRNVGSTTGELVVKVVDNAQVTSLFLGGLYDAKVGDSTESLETGFSTNVRCTIDGSDGAKVTNLYGAGFSGTVYANVTADIINMTGTNVYGGGQNLADKNYGTFTVNLSNSSLGVISSRNVDKTNDPVGTITVNVLKGDNTVTKGIVLRATDCISVKLGKATLTTTGFYSTYTNASKPTAGGTGSPNFTIDATDFAFAENETQEKFLTTTAKYASANFTIMEGENISSRYIVVNDASKNYYVVEEHPVAYNSLWYGLAEGTEVTAFGAKYTIGTDAFADASQAVAKAGELSTYVRSVDSFYCPEWAAHTVIIDGETIAVPAKSFGDKVSVNVDGAAMELTIGIDAFTSLADAKQVAGIRYAAVRYGETTNYTSRQAVLSDDNQTVVLSHHTDTSSGFNVGLIGGDYAEGVVIIANDSSISQFDVYGASHTSHFTVIVDHSYVNTFYSGVKASNVAYEYDDAGRVIWTAGKHGTVDHIIRNGGTVTNAYFGTGSEGSTGDVNITLENVTVKNVYGSGSASGGWFCGNATLILKGSSVTAFYGKNQETSGGAHFISIVAEEGENRIGSFSDNATYVSGIEVLVKAGAALDMALGDLGRSSNIEAAGLLRLRSLIQTGTMTLASGGTLSITALTNQGTAGIAAGGVLAATGAVTNSDTGVITAERGASFSFGSNFTNAGSFTFSVENMLNVTGDFTNTGTITIDATGYAFPADNYSVKVVHAGHYLTGALDIDNHYQVVGAAENCGLYTYYNNIYYGETPVYVASVWRNVGVGETVSFAGKSLTMGTDAFASADDAKAKGYRNILTAEVYVDAAWSTKSPNEKITVTLVDGSTVDAFYGVNAFSDFDSAVTALANGGAGIDIVGTGVSGTTATVNTPLYLENGTSLSVTTLNIGFQGDFRILENASFSASTSFNNSGTTLVESGATFAPVYLQNIGTLTLENGATYSFSNVDNNGGTLNITVAGGLTVSGILSNSGTINIDAEGYTFAPGVTSVKVVETGNSITSLTGYELLNGAEGKELFLWEGDIWYGKVPGYYSAGWADKTGTVNVPGGTATLGENAFATYDEYLAYDSECKQILDRYSVANAKLGDIVTLKLPSGTIVDAVIDNKVFFAGSTIGESTEAWSNFTDYSGNEIVVYGGTLTGGRTIVFNCSGIKTAFYNYTAICTVSASSGPGPIIGANNGGKTGEIIIGKGSHVEDVSLGRDMGNSTDIDWTAHVEDDATINVLSAIFNKTASCSSEYTKDASGKLVWDGGYSKAHFILTGGSVTTVAPTNYSGAFTGEITIDISGNAKIGSLAATNVANSQNIAANFLINMAGGTINKIDAMPNATGIGDRYFAIVAGGSTTSTIGSVNNVASSSGTDVLVKENSTLLLNSGLNIKGGVTLESGAAFTVQNLTLTGTAGLTLGDGATITCANLTLSGGGTLALDSDASITCDNLGFNGTSTLASGAAITCAGAMSLNAGSSMTVAATAAVTSGNFTVVAGSTVDVAKGAEMTFNSAFSNAGSYTFAAENCLTVSGTLTNTGTIYVDAKDYAFTPDVVAIKVVDAQNDITSLAGYELKNGADGKKLFLRDGNIWYGDDKVIYFSDDWVEFAGSTGTFPVIVDGGTHTYNVDAFFRYADAEKAADGKYPLKSPDNFFSYDWKNQTGPQDVIYRGGTFRAPISNANAFIKLFNNWDDAVSAAGATGKLLITGGSNSIGARTHWDVANIVVTGTTITKASSFQGTALSNGVDGGTSSFTVGQGANVASVAFGSTGAVTGISSTINVVNGGVTGEIYLCGNNGDKAAGEMYLNVDGGATGIVRFGPGGNYTNDADVNINISNGGRSSLQFRANNGSGTVTIKAGRTVAVTLDGGTITGFANANGKLVKEEGAKVTLTVNGKSVFGNGNNFMNDFDSITINVAGASSGLVINSNNNYAGTITVDLADCQYDQARYLLLSLPSAIDTQRIVIQNEDITKGYSLVVEGSNYYYQATSYYFSDDWQDLANGTPVEVDGGTHIIGTDAFFKYGDAETAAAGRHPLKSTDNFFSFDWVDKTGPQDVVYRGGTFRAPISNANADIKLFKTLESAQKAAETTGSLLITGGSSQPGTASNSRFAWNYKNTVVTNAQITAKEKINGALYSIGAAGSSNKFTVGEGGYVNSLGAGHNDYSGTHDLTIKSSTIEVLDGGSVSYIYYSNAAGGILTGEVNVTLKGGRVGRIQPSIGLTTGNTGNVNISITDNSFVGEMQMGGDSTSASWTLAAGYHLTVTLADSTIYRLRGYGPIVKGDGASIDLKVTGTANIQIDGTDDGHELGLSRFDSLTIKVDENAGGLTVGGNAFSYNGTITADIRDCQHAKDQYLIVSAPGVSADNVSILGEQSSDYELKQIGDAVYYQKKPVYFSVAWEGLTDGTGVKFGDKDLVIGTNAFRNYGDALEAGFSIVASADIYLNSTYSADTPIEIPSGTATYIATFGEDAFNTAAKAVEKAKEGSSLRVTAWGNTNLTGLNGFENVFLNDIDSLTTVTVMTGGTVAKLNVIADTVQCNVFNTVTGGEVTGDVNLTVTDMTCTGGSGALYGLKGADAVIGGNLNITVNSGDIQSGIYAVEENSTVTGKVTVTLGDCTLGKRGVVIKDKVTVGGADLIITGNATVSTVNNADLTNRVFQTITVNSGATLNYGVTTETNKKYVTAVVNLVNNGTFNYDAEIGQNAYETVATGTIEGNAITSSVGNVIFTKDGTTYAAEVQTRMMIDATLTGKSFLDVVEIGGVNYIYGISAFQTGTEAQGAAFYNNEATTLVMVGQKIDEPVHGNGHVEFNGSTVTKSVYAGQTVTGGEVSADTSVEIVGIEGQNGSYAALIGAHEVTGDVTQSGNSSITVSGENNIAGKAIVGSSYLTDGNLTFGEGSTSTVTVESGSFSSFVIGGALANKENAHITGTLDTEVLISGGTVKAVCGGCYLQGGTTTEGEFFQGTISVGGTSNVTISNGVVINSVFGGNLSKFTENSTTSTSTWNGNTSVTIDVSGENNVYIGGHIVAGSEGKGLISGNTQITFTGNGANLTVNGHIVGGSSSGTDGSAEAASGVTGTRTLSFAEFNGTVGSNGKKVTGFTNVEVNKSDVDIAGYGQLKSVTDWNITDGSIGWEKGTNDFDSDKLTLVHTDALGDDWTVFRLTEALTTDWECFYTNENTDKIANINLSINGTEGIAWWNDTNNGYIATLDGTDYKFYLDETDNALKVAKLA